MTPRRLIALYLVLLAASHLWMLTRERAEYDPTRAQPGRTVVEIPAMGRDGPVAGATSHVSVLHFESALAEREELLPVVLLHGSPGSARNWGALGPRLAASGRRTLALDLPGFGRSSPGAPSYSLRAHARATLAVLDELGIERAHLVTWSMGGGVSLHVAALAPERVASLAQVAALGVQEAEGSGSYHFEHLKYALLWFGLAVVPEAFPHFGFFGPYGRGQSFVRNFWDTDQRLLRPIMRELETPTLILHGRRDFLVPAWAAEESHALIGPSRLVMLEASHFLPLGEQAAVTMEYLEPFLERHDARGAPVERGYLDLSVAPTGLDRLALEPYTLGRRVPWWAQVALLAALALAAPWLAALGAGLLVAGLQLDFGLAFIACAAGALAGMSAGTSAGPARGAGRAIRMLRRLASVPLVLVAGMAAGGGAALLFTPAAQWLGALVLGLGVWSAGCRLARHWARAPRAGD